MANGVPLYFKRNYIHLIYNLEFSCDKSRMDYPHNQHFYVILRKMERRFNGIDNTIIYEGTRGAKETYEINGFFLFPSSISIYYKRIGFYEEKDFQNFLKNNSLPCFIQKLKKHQESVSLYTPNPNIISRAIKNIPFMASSFPLVPSIINHDSLLSAFYGISSFFMKSVFKQT